MSFEGFSGRTLTLYHTTSPENAASIISQQRFCLGKSSSSFGSGIYFALTPEDSKRKATSKGATLVAKVHVGRSLICTSKYCFTQYELKTKGADSVLNKMFNGDEYVVYDSCQVSNIKLHSEEGRLVLPFRIRGVLIQTGVVVGGIRCVVLRPFDLNLSLVLT